MTSQPSVVDATTSPPQSLDDGGTSLFKSLPLSRAAAEVDTSAPPGYERLKLKICGVAPLLMHSGQLANPMNSHAREKARVSKKRAKTEADFEILSKIEWFGGLYIHKGAPCIPGENVEAGLIGAAKKNKRGQQAKAGIISDGFWPLEYDGSRDLEKLWQDERFRLVVGVRQQNSRIMRTRPIFREWAAVIEIDYLPDQLDRREVIEAVHIMGRIIGLGDWRPKFGRFEVVPLA